MKKLLWGITSLTLLCLAGTLAHPSQAHALTTQQAAGFNVITSPLPIKLTTAPGTTVTTELRIKNDGTNPETIQVGLMKFGASGDNGTPDLYALTSSDTYGSWVHFSPSEFVAQPNVWQTVKMTINVPASASLGYYLAVTFSRASQTGATGNAASLHGSVAELVLLQVPTANENRTIQVLSFTATHKLYEYLPATFQVRLRNSGNTYVSPEGNVFITRGSTSVQTLDLNDAGGSVLPQSNRLFSIPWSNGFPVYTQKLVNKLPVLDSHGKPKMVLQWNFSKVGDFRFGEYTAKLLVVYNNGQSDVPLQSQLTFWVLPWKIMLLALALLILIGFGVFTLVRSIVRKARGGVGRFGKGQRAHARR